MAKQVRRTKRVDTAESLREQIAELELQKELINLDIQKLQLRIKYLEKKPGLGFNAVWDAGRYALENQVRIKLNEDNWGLIDEKLQDYTVFPIKEEDSITKDSVIQHL